LVSLLSRDAFALRFDSDAGPLPRNLCLVGSSATERRWCASPERIVADPTWNARVVPTLRFLDERVRGKLGLDAFWFVLCMHDGWRERVAWTDRYRWIEPGAIDDLGEWRGAPGDLPRLSARQPWVACYAAHAGDPSAFLLPEAHWLAQGYYAGLFDEVARTSPPWEKRHARAVHAGGDHGSAANLFAPPAEGAHPRRLLRDAVRDGKLPVDVTLGGRVTRAIQLNYRWILDVDGFVRTWDAWAWKMASGATVLSPASPWETWFTREFRAWEHFVPVANDFSDLGERLEWCRNHDDACRAIGQAARARALEVYGPSRVADALAGRLRERLAHSGS
jgi:hypothetical protein